MEETELLEALDRRAAGAVAALDGRVADVEPPSLRVEADRPRRRWTTFLVAAGLVLVALLGIGLALGDRDDEAGTIADDRDSSVQTDDGLTRLALADPEALGYSVRAAFDGPSTVPAPGTEQVDIHFTAHGPAGAADPWAEVVIATTHPVDEYTFLGELVDIGGPEAVHVPMGWADRVIWRDGDQARMIMSSRVRDGDLVDVAAAAVAAGWIGDGPLPGHEVLHAGTPDAFQPGLEYAGLGPTGWQGIAYQGSGSVEDFVIAWRPGGPESLDALHSLVDAETTAVDGRDVLISDAGTATHVAWLLDDGTLVQLATFGDVDAVLAEVLPELEPISDDELQSLAAAHPPPADTPLVEPADGIYEPRSEGEVLASISLTEGGTEYRLDIQPDRSGGFATMLSIEDASGASGSGGPVRDLDTPFLQAGGLSDGSGSTPVVVSGVLPAGVPGDLTGTGFVDRTTGEEASSW